MKRSFCHHLVERVDLALVLDHQASAFEAGTAFLLDGGGHPELSHNAIFGAEPMLTFRAWRTSERGADGTLQCRIVIEDDAGTVTEHVGDPFVALRSLLEEHAVDPSVYAARPLPLLAGAVGYIGYEIGQCVERLPCRARPGVGMPDMAFSFHQWVLGRDDAGATWLSVVGWGEDDAAARRDAGEVRDRVARKVREGASEPPPPAKREIAIVRAVSRETYVEHVRRARDHIVDGDAFEICLTHAMDAAWDGDPWSLFRTLRRDNPAPFASILDLPEGAVVSSSPERFLRLDEERIAESRPIKGTRPRGASPVEDDRLAHELASSPKDRAENAMIVDLVRNDLGRVCRFGSVAVPAVYAVERYATVHQLVSTITGELSPERDAIDLVRACFPPGSMTGAPKIEAMTILESLEPTERGPYAGALGYFDFGGTIDLSVVIRTIVVRDGRAHFHAGGAIVADSDPEAEHEETLHKTRALVRALGEAP